MIEVGGIGSEKLYSVEIEWLQESFGSHHNFIDCEPVFVEKKREDDDDLRDYDLEGPEGRSCEIGSANSKQSQESQLAR